MAVKRTFSTRELAQIWNVSESTIKRWADAGELRCYRTPGGHRKFQLEDICMFQTRRGFQATGLLTTENWEDPEIEDSLNRKKLDKVRQELCYLGVQNQRHRIKNLLERLYIRGMGIVELYDEVIVQTVGRAEEALKAGELTVGQERLLQNNLEEAMCYLFPQLIRRPHNGKTGLCAAPQDRCRLHVNAVCRILEVEGWECLNLGSDVPFRAMAEMVEAEPVNLVCVVSTSDEPLSDFGALGKAAKTYRIPLVLLTSSSVAPNLFEGCPHDEYFPDFRSFHCYVMRFAN